MARAHYTPLQQEVVVLAAALDMIDGLVNRGMFEDPLTTGPTNLWFKTRMSKRMFAVLLGDFLAQPQARGKNPVPFGLAAPAPGDKGSARTYLRYLADVADKPKLGTEAKGLQRTVTGFRTWLDAELTCPKVWLPGPGIEFDMTIERGWMLQVVADMSKHNFSRLEGRIKQLQAMLARHGHTVDEGELCTELPVFEEWLYDHLFSYHASTIGEFLNEIRWAIYDYLRPEFVRAFRPGKDGLYTFDLPDELSEGLARGMYWRLMNAMRKPPSFPRFVVTPHLKAEF